MKKNFIGLTRKYKHTVESRKNFVLFIFIFILVYS